MIVELPGAEARAFPSKIEDNGVSEPLWCPGLTMRDYFAAQALIGILACYREFGEVEDAAMKDKARLRVAFAYEHADEMIKQMKGKAT